MQCQMMNFGLLTWRKIPYQLPNQALGANISILLPTVQAPAEASSAAGDKRVLAAGTAKERETLSFLTTLSAPYVTGSLACKAASSGLGVISAADS